ncbi:MAG: FAD binding domain-containing protein [Deltaproteobacteria bacterium]|nr:FAD binding domain-containing protein [Deltaproteobacteria bacterium]
MLPAFDYVRPANLAEAAAALAREGAVALAGGSDIMGIMRDGVQNPATLVSLTGLDELRGISETAAGGLALGALTTVHEVATHPLVVERYPALAQAAAAVGSPQLRNQGTLGGNLCQKPRCWYYRGEFHCARKGGLRCYALRGQNQFHALFGTAGRCAYVHPSDTAPALAAYGAVVLTTGPEGARRLPAGEFHVPPATAIDRETVLLPGEVVTGVELPPAEGAWGRYRKIRARGAWDFALAGAALVLNLEGRRVARARVVLSGVAAVPWRSMPAEEALEGRELTPGVARDAARAALSGARALAHNRYKLYLLEGLLTEELTGLARVQG